MPRPEPVHEPEPLPDAVPALAELVASLHMLRSVPGGLHPATLRAYDAVRAAIDAFGWSSPAEIAARIRANQAARR